MFMIRVIISKIIIVMTIISININNNNWIGNIAKVWFTDFVWSIVQQTVVEKFFIRELVIIVMIIWSGDFHGDKGRADKHEINFNKNVLC